MSNSFCQKGMIPWGMGGGGVEERGNLCDTRIAEIIYMYRSVFSVNECEVNKGQ